MAKGRQFNARRRGGDVHNVMAISADRITDVSYFIFSKNFNPHF